MAVSSKHLTIGELRKAVKDGRLSKEEALDILRPLLNVAFGQYSGTSFSQSILQSISATFRTLPKLEEMVAPRVRKAVTILATNGWFVSDKIDRFDVFDLAEEGRLTDASRTLVKYFRSHLRSIQHLLSEAFPEREQIFHQAFRAHRKKLYFLSVPIFLIQADGICFDVLGANYFRKRKRRPATADLVKDISGTPYLGAFLEPLRIILPVSKDTRYLDSKGRDFNRHSILHGLTASYGTEINSFKSLSLVHFLSTVVGAHCKQDRATA